MRTSPNSSRLLVALIALIVGVATGAGVAEAQNGVAAINFESPALVGAESRVAAGQVGSDTVLFDDGVSGCCVAPQITPATGSGTDVVRYDPEWASRQLLGQNTPGSTGYAVTPGGRTVSAHGAERVSAEGPGRPPTYLPTVDEILDTGTSIRFDPVRDSIQVRAPQIPGKPYVVVDSGGSHVVTVMVPK